MSICVAVGCGRIRFELHAVDERDASFDASNHHDAASSEDVTRSDSSLQSDASETSDGATPPDSGPPVLGPFGPPRLLAISDPDANDEDPAVSADGLELYFRSNRAGGIGADDIWRSTRPARDEPWGEPTLVTELSSTAAEKAPFITFDALTFALSSSRSGGVGGEDIYIARRASRGSSWGALVLQDDLCSNQDDNGPVLSPDGAAIVFQSLRSGSQLDDFYFAMSTGVNAWSAPTRLVQLNSSSNDQGAHVSSDSLRVYFNSSRSGDHEIYIGSRENTDVLWGNVTLVPELGSPDSNDEDPTLTIDERYIVFASDRLGNGNDLYEASR